MDPATGSAHAVPTAPAEAPMTSPSPDNANDEQKALATTLRATWFGASLDDPTIGRLSALARRRTAKAGEVLLVEGGRSDEFGVVVTGRLALRMLVPERGMVTILTVEPGDLYGWSAIAAPQRATSTVVAIEPSELIAFDGMDLRLALAEDDRLAAALYPRVLEAVSRRLSATRLQLLDLFTHREPEAW
jgi:CRP-like cAMP-binding protein